jgi:hypothetical protein
VGFDLHLPGLAVCAAPPTKTPHWVKAGADDPTIERDVHECEARANDAFASERAIIDQKAGLSWMLQGYVIVPLQREILLQEAAKHAEEVFDNCTACRRFHQRRLGEGARESLDAADDRVRRHSSSRPVDSCA